MVNSRSPTFTHSPSLKWSFSTKPETRARISTTASASKRPEYSSHWMTRLAIGSETPTGMAGGRPWAKAGRGEKARKAAASATRRRTENKRLSPPAGTDSASRDAHVVAAQQHFNDLRGNWPEAGRAKHMDQMITI